MITTFQHNNHDLQFQQTGYTCGPTALLNLLILKGDNSHSEEELAEKIGTTIEMGTGVELMEAGAKALGLEVMEAKEHSTLEELQAHLDSGHSVIVNYYYALQEVGHYAQVVEYDDKALYLLDPIAGNMRILKDDFEKNWHNKKRHIKRWLIAVK